MSADPDLIAALESAVTSCPDNKSLRLHLASLLLEAGRADAALGHARHVLVGDPADLQALGLAAMAAELSGDAAAAAGYGRLLDALGGRVPGPAVRETVPVDGSAAAEAAAVVDPDVERPAVRLADVAGMGEVKRRLETAFLGPLRNPELRAAFGASLRGGLLLWGPPGCGKTFIARALAGELGASFLSFGLADVLDMYLGQSEGNLHEVFETARAAAPCVLFLDEVDALGQKRVNLRHSGGLRNVVAQLLVEFDGVDGTNEGVFVLGATNHPWDLDVALRRPGRFDRTLLVLPPDRPAREAILRFHLKGRPLASDVDLGRLADRTDGFTGADLAHVAETATSSALAASVAAGSVRPIGNHDLGTALAEVRPSTGPWFEAAAGYARFADHGSDYAELLDYLRRRRGRPGGRT